jgi:uncharacterized protein (DUF427 family)
VDVLTSAKHIVVKVDGVVVADSRTPVLLYETHLPTRYYLPKTNVNLEFLEPSDKRDFCPYKGVSNYYDLVINGKRFKDYAWWHKYPTMESGAITGKISFYNEKVDIYIDGVKEQK